VQILFGNLQVLFQGLALGSIHALVALGLTTIRLGGHYLATITISFQQILDLILVNWIEVTHGPDRIAGIGRPVLFGRELADDRAYLLFCAVALYLLVFAVWRLPHTRLGRAMRSVRENELAAEVVGVHTLCTKVTAFALSALLGANGAGKSTTLKTISGLVLPTQGEVVFEGRPLQRSSPEAIARMGISHVPEGRRVFPGLTVRENILLGASNRKGVRRALLEQEADEIFGIFPEIRPFENALGWTLSGGQQQMLAVARGLMARPKLLLLHEPSLGLAPLIVQNLFATILLVEQNANIALSVADRGYVLETGLLTMEGSASDLLGNDEVRAACLGGHHA